MGKVMFEMLSRFATIFSDAFVAQTALHYSDDARPSWPGAIAGRLAIHDAYLAMALVIKCKFVA